MKKLFAAIITLIITGSVAFSEARYVINTSHSGAIRAMEYHQNSKTLLSGGEDGILRIWDIETGKTTHSFRISDYPIHTIKVHPDKNNAAVLSEKKNGFVISVWNGDTEKLLYEMSYEKRPLFFDFSPLGNYFVVCDENWQSLHFYNAGTGASISKFKTGFGIVTYFTFSGTEKNFMTYQPTGKITYWSVSNQQKITEFPTETTFIPIGITADKRNIIGFDENRVLLIDLSTGKESAVIKLDSLVFSVADQEGNSIVCYTRPAWGSSRISRYKIDGSKFSPGWSITVDKDMPVTSFTFSEKGLLSADKNGTIYRYSDSGRRETLFQNTLARISDISFSNDTLAIGTQNNIVIIRSSFLGPQDKQATLSEDELSTFTRRNPFSNADIGLSFFPDKGLYLWPKGDRNGALSLMDNDEFSRVRQCTSFSKPLINMIFSAPAYVSLETSGVARVLLPDTYRSSFQYTAQGINTAAIIDKDLFLCGRNKLSEFDSPLMLINAKSGETTIIPDSAAVIFDMKYDTDKKVLYTLGFETRDNDYWTVIKKRTGDMFSSETTIYSEKNDSTFSTLALDQINHTLYFALGSNTVYSYSNGAITKLEKSPQIIKKILVTDSKLFSLNSDSSITVWDAGSTDVILHFYLFQDMSWILLTRGGKYFTQGNGEDYLNVFEGTRFGSNVIEKYRLKFKTLNRGKDSE
ncbi:MAG: hypothetical protein JW904_11150 [Spirochaetales bacterium]|nr:hypothetical protein [Spirochaetales bacterium]